MEKYSCVIVGGGPAGYTAAIYAARANLKPVMFTGLQPGGQLMLTTDVENYPAYPNGVKGPEMMEDFRLQAERFGTKLFYEPVVSVDFSKPLKKLVLDDEREIFADTVIIATGASAKWLGLESETKLYGGGVSACAVCDGYFYRAQEVAIVGGGDTACEEASYLAKLCKKVYMVVRTDKMRASKIMQERVMKTPNIEILWNQRPVEIHGDKVVEAIELESSLTKERMKLTVKGVFIAIGHQPNTEVFKGHIDMDENGYIITQDKSTYTSVDGVFACGDVQDHTYRQAVTAAGTGCMAALDAERWLAARG